MNLARGIASGLLALPVVAAAQSFAHPADGGRIYASMNVARAAPPLLRHADIAGGFALVELPPTVDPTASAPRRPRHALRMRSDVAESAVRSLGLDATECAMLFRVNSRAGAAGSGTAVVLKPQMHLHCRFF